MINQMKFFFIIILFAFTAKNLLAETIDNVVEIAPPYESDSFVDLRISIANTYESLMFVDEVWEVVGVCNNSPDLIIKIIKSYESDIFSDLKIKFAKSGELDFVDKKICITNTHPLDKILEVLNLSE